MHHAGLSAPWRRANPRMACQSVAAVMDEQALLGLNPNADARYRQRVSSGQLTQLWGRMGGFGGSYLTLQCLPCCVCLSRPWPTLSSLRSPRMPGRYAPKPWLKAYTGEFGSAAPWLHTLRV